MYMNKCEHREKEEETVRQDPPCMHKALSFAQKGGGEAPVREREATVTCRVIVAWSP